MLRLWTFSDFRSRHIVGVAGDDIMFHILVFAEFIWRNSHHISMILFLSTVKAKVAELFFMEDKVMSTL